MEYRFEFRVLLKPYLYSKLYFYSYLLYLMIRTVFRNVIQSCTYFVKNSIFFIVDRLFAKTKNGPDGRPAHASI